MSVSHYRVAVARSWKQARAHRHAWAALYARRLEDNVFLRPEFLLPLLEHGSDGHRYAIVFVYDGTDRLVAVAALDEGADARGFPGRLVSTWSHPLLFDATPLLDRRRGAEAAAELWRWMIDPDRAWSLVSWSRVRLDAASWQCLAAAIDHTGERWWARRVYRRAALRRPAGWEEYLASLSRSRRKRLRRVDRRLAGAGRVERRAIRAPGVDVVDRFLALEQAGWKGREGTALACHPRQESFFREALARLGEAALILELLLDGRPIAMTANFVDGERLYAYKSAYEPELADLSPGIAIESDLVRWLSADTSLALVDSCAEEDSHLTGIWGDRVPMGEIVCSTGALSALSVSAAPHVRRARGLWQELRRAAD